MLATQIMSPLVRICRVLNGADVNHKLDIVFCFKYYMPRPTNRRPSIQRKKKKQTVKIVQEYGVEFQAVSDSVPSVRGAAIVRMNTRLCVCVCVCVCVCAYGEG